MATPTIRGRGAASNPRNRFEPLVVIPDEEARGPEDPGPRTRFFRDATRTVIATNNSPDVGFDTSVNPYRGCEHGCVYCAWGEAPILMADGTTRPLAGLAAGDEIFGTVRKGWYRRYVKTIVLAHWETQKPAYRVTLEDGTELVASGDHRFLTLRGWKFVTGTQQGVTRRPHLRVNDELLGTGGFVVPGRPSNDYRLGYLCGIIRDDGHLGTHEYRRASGRTGRLHQFRLAMVDAPALLRTAEYLTGFGVETAPFLCQKATGTRKEMRGVRAHSRTSVERISELIAWPGRPSRAWSAGFLAGIFDAEGSYSAGILRIPNTDRAIVDTAVRAMGSLGFAVTLERVTRNRARPITIVRLRGGLKEHLRFFHTVDPAILRKRVIDGQALKGGARLRVVSIEPVGSMTLFDITTGTGDFIANGVISHNCYARPFHEYLGFSSGLDFESKILVKEDAPELLRRELMKPSWQPRVIALSGVTDPYQPAERHLRITRGCIEVLAEFRNPVGIITKNYLVTRDIDLFAELAQYNAVAVNLSVTTLNEKLQRVMEPRTSVPARRLKAIEQLARAGIPVRVMVAPVVPGLTEHELPGIIAAAAEAGATGAGYIVLRLPYAVKDLFVEWLEQHFPDRKAKVLNRLRELHDGGLYKSEFHTRMSGEGEWAQQIEALFGAACRRAGFPAERPQLSTAAFRRPGRGGQLGLFE